MALEKARGRLPKAGSLAVVIGAGRSGMAAVKLLLKYKIQVRLLEKNPDVLDDAKIAEMQTAGVQVIIGPHDKSSFADAALIIPSPGMPISALDQWVDRSPQGPEIISELELSYRCLDNEPILAITGTSGKTTTASLAASMLKTQGYSVFLGGNIGTPLAEYILSGRKADVLVLECSSFQLQGCVTFCPRVAVLLNITPNHLDYHKDMAEYIEAKFRIFRCQEPGDLAILGPGVSEIASGFSIPARKVNLVKPETFGTLKLLGWHNLLNAEAAWIACKFFGVSMENAARAVAEFEPLPHRLENLGEIKGITYVNDSKCTTASALKAALEAFDRPVRLLCGGKFKGGDLRALVPLIREHVVEVALFGDSREYFEQAWNGVVPISWHPTLRQAVARLRGAAAKGDVILLAPATSSYDLYANYIERGNDFRNIVYGLA